MAEVRAFRRDDRQQVTALVNAHVQAVLPGVTLSVNAVLSRLEREPGEFIVDPWVAQRATLVAAERGRVVAAAHLRHYREDEDVGESYRGAGEIGWLLCWPEAPYWPDSGAGDVLAQASIGQLERWGAGRLYADGSLPAPGVYGVPDCWPHVEAIYERAGFVHTGHAEVVLAASVDDLPRAGRVPVPGIDIRRELGSNGTRLTAMVDDERIGFVDIDTDLTGGGTLSRLAGWGDIGNFEVEAAYRRRGVGTWLMAQAADWLRLGRVRRVLAYAWVEHAEDRAFYTSVGFHELACNKRGWEMSGGQMRRD